MTTENQYKYDYIIAGAGCAGLSLAMQLKISGVSFNKILLIDKDLKNKNDRTWCFWTKQEKNWFDEVIFRRWDKFSFAGNGFEKTFDLAPYHYLMVQGIDFYDYCLSKLKSDPRFEIVTDTIEEIYTSENLAFLKTKNNAFCCEYLFNSAFRKLDKKTYQTNYVQHFKGWLIESSVSSFKSDCPVFMDFSIDQYHDCRFCYVLPFSDRKALIEYTGFSTHALKDEVYDTELKKYIELNLGIREYRILSTEKGEIPMAESEFINLHGKRVINIGTAGGSSKPSTGYTFYFIQKNIGYLVDQLKENRKQIIPQKRKRRYLLYDSVLLDVINRKEILAATVFTGLFKNTLVKYLLAFLNEESNLKVDLQIMLAVPKKYFIKSMLQKIIK